MPIYTWDEIEGQIATTETWPADESAEEGGWETVEDNEDHRIYRSSRGHLAISVQAEDEDEARMFLLELRTMQAHDAELERKRAEVYNYGWGANSAEDYHSIASKTSHGILTTTLDERAGEVYHTWDDY